MIDSLIQERAATKVRKPYTISKQRERWTDEEHNCFLEALKLYGRAWRKIEEHVGTKTAVQIRSHAQKFFTKVARESNGDDTNQVRAIEIPPPRPKKKPLRPYPRKLGNSPNIQANEKQELSISLKIPTSEQDNMSPTSVFSAVRSDAFGSSASSPVSCVNGSDPVEMNLSEQENGCQSGITSVNDGSKSQLQNKSDIEIDLGIDDAPVASLKLFGKTLQAAEPHTYQNATDEGRSEINVWPNGVMPLFYILPYQGVTAGGVHVPMIWGFNGESMSHGTKAQNLSSEQEQSPSVGEVADNTKAGVLRVIDDSSHDKLKFRQSETSAFRSLKVSSRKPGSKGFVPYSRCVLAQGSRVSLGHCCVGEEGEVAPL